MSLWYVVRAHRDQAITFDRSEFNDARWFAFNEVPLERADPHLGRFLSKVSVSPFSERPVATADLLKQIATPV